ncbi:MAG: anion permease [Acidobacteria bacterium]|nr:MAG: anion permease [Acidobacteriota bacterium]
MLSLVIFIIIIALIFDFINGFHDAANSIATVVSTRVLTPRFAVVWAGFFNFVAAFGFGTNVAKTLGSGMIVLDVVTEYVILAGLIGAIAWDIITWYFGLPTSSSHALIGGYAGAAIAKAGIASIIPSGWYKTLTFVVLSPIIGLILGFSFMVIVLWIFRNFTPSSIEKYFGKLQLVSAALFSLGHGTNDAQKTMGIIAGVLYKTGYLTSFRIPFWVILICHAAIGLGTMAGGWRIVKTMGQKITKLRPVGGFCAETAGAATLLGTAIAGIPISTTHTITGAVMGVGATRRLSSVRWGVANRIVWAWVLTIPLSAFMAAVTYRLIALLVE